MMSKAADAALAYVPISQSGLGLHQTSNLPLSPQLFNFGEVPDNMRIGTQSSTQQNASDQKETSKQQVAEKIIEAEKSIHATKYNIGIADLRRETVQEHEKRKYIKVASAQPYLSDAEIMSFELTKITNELEDKPVKKQTGFSTPSDTQQNLTTGSIKTIGYSSQQQKKQKIAVVADVNKTLGITPKRRPNGLSMPLSEKDAERVIQLAKANSNIQTDIQDNNVISIRYSGSNTQNQYDEIITASIAPARYDMEDSVILSESGDSSAPSKIEDVARYTILNSPEIGVFRSRWQRAYHGIDLAKSGYRPTLDLSLSAAQKYDIKNSTYEGKNKNGTGALSLSQPIFDGLSTKHLVQRAKYIYEASKYDLEGKAEEVVLKMSEAYLDVMEQGQYIANAKQNISAHQRFYNLVKASEAEGNANQADVQRAFTRLENARNMLTDFETAKQRAIGKFYRITGLEPHQLKMPKAFDKEAMVTRAQVQDIVNRNPELLALRAEMMAFEAELESNNSGNLPSLSFEANASGTREITTEPSDFGKSVEGKLVLSWNLYDGGKTKNQGREIKERVREKAYSHKLAYLEQEEKLIESIRTMETSRKKSGSLSKQVDANARVAELYYEQFKVGNKRLIEVLDAQSDLFSIRRERIRNKFDRIRANYRALNLKADLVKTLMQQDAIDVIQNAG